MAQHLGLSGQMEGSFPPCHVLGTGSVAVSGSLRAALGSIPPPVIVSPQVSSETQGVSGTCPGVLRESSVPPLSAQPSMIISIILCIVLMFGFDQAVCTTDRPPDGRGRAPWGWEPLAGFQGYPVCLISKETERLIQRRREIQYFCI